MSKVMRLSDEHAAEAEVRRLTQELQEGTEPLATAFVLPMLVRRLYDMEVLRKQPLSSLGRAYTLMQAVGDGELRLGRVGHQYAVWKMY